MPDDDECKYECYEAVKKKPEAAKADAKVHNEMKNDVDRGEESAVVRCDIEEHVTTWYLHTAASSVRMTILYADRMARPDLLRPTPCLAPYVTKWRP